MTFAFRQEMRRTMSSLNEHILEAKKNFDFQNELEIDLTNDDSKQQYEQITLKLNDEVHKIFELQENWTNFISNLPSEQREDEQEIFDHYFEATGCNDMYNEANDIIMGLEMKLDCFGSRNENVESIDNDFSPLTGQQVDELLEEEDNSLASAPVVKSEPVAKIPVSRKRAALDNNNNGGKHKKRSRIVDAANDNTNSAQPRAELCHHFSIPSSSWKAVKRAANLTKFLTYNARKLMQPSILLNTRLLLAEVEEAVKNVEKTQKNRC